MKLKSLLFGSAAVLAAGTGTQAADLPVAEPVEYVRICDAFGVGFYYIPGTDTCLRVSGRVFAESNYVNGDDFVTPLSVSGEEPVAGFFGPGAIPAFPGLGVGTVNNTFPTVYSDEEREFNNWTSRVRANIRLDARTQTDFGLIRVFIDAESNRGNANYGNGDGGAAFEPVAAFIQITNDWGTYTAGRTGSFFNFFGSGLFNSRGVGVDASDDDKNVFAWTFAGANGFSGTIAVEDPLTGHNRQDSSVAFATFGGPLAAGEFAPGVPLSAVPFGSTPGFDDYEGQEAPDLVANLRFDQGWGSAQIMGAVRHLHDVERFESGFGAGIFGAEAVPGTDESEDGSEIGFAVGAGLGLNLPFFGLRFDSQAGYSEGAIRYITGDPISSPFFGGITTGDFNGPEAEDSLTEAWSVRAALSGKFTETVGFSVAGSYTEVDSDENTFDVIPGLTLTTEGIDYNHFGVGTQLNWTPVEGLTFGWEAAYAEVEIENNAAQRQALCNFCTGEGADGEFEMYRTTFRVNRDF